MNDSLSSLCRDQQRRWLEGERAVVEEYLARDPGLRENAEAVLDLIYNEIVLRERRGEMPVLDEYLRRFPQFAAQLEVQFQVHVMIEGAFLASHGAKQHALIPTFPGYEILEELGRGGMGVVYKARQLSLNRLVALKVISSGVHASRQELTRFQIEAQAAARLRHANIVQIYEIGEHAGVRYLAMELIDGTNLEEFTRHRTPSAPDAAALIETLARTMAHVHQQGIVHRDLKPANVLLEELGARGQGSGARIEKMYH